MMPPCDHTGVPGLVGFTHFHSSTTSGSASLMSLRILPRVAPRQSPSSTILLEMSSEADWPWLAPPPACFMFPSSLNVKLFCVLGVQSLSASELHRVDGRHDAIIFTSALDSCRSYSRRGPRESRLCRRGSTCGSPRNLTPAAIIRLYSRKQ